MNSARFRISPFAVLLLFTKLNFSTTRFYSDFNISKSFEIPEIEKKYRLLRNPSLSSFVQGIVCYIRLHIAYGTRTFKRLRKRDFLLVYKVGCCSFSTTYHLSNIILTLQNVGKIGTCVFFTQNGIEQTEEQKGWNKSLLICL